MTTKQLSVFIENRCGRLGEVLATLKSEGVNILSLSLADTSEYGLLRLIVSDSVSGKKVLSESGFSTMLTDVFCVEIGHKSGTLADLVKLLSDAKVAVEYMYGLSTEGGRAYVVMKLSDVEQANKVFAENGVKTLSEADICAL